MKDVVNKLRAVEKETSSERGNYELFALFLREDSSDKWDIIVASSWIDANKEEALRYLAFKVQNALTQSDILKISRIVIIDENNPALLTLVDAFSVEHSSFEIKDCNIFGLQIKHGFLITSKKTEHV